MGSNVETDDVLEAIHEHPDPVVTASGLSDRLPVGSRTVLNRLDVLEAAGAVVRKDVGARAVVWWLPGTRKPRPDAAARERSLKADQADFQDVAGEEHSDDAGGPRDEREAVREDVDDLDLPGHGEKLEARREALVDLHQHLQMTGAAEKSDFLKVLEAHEHGYDSAESFWKNIISGKDTLKSLPGVKSPEEGSSLWRFDR